MVAILKKHSREILQNPRISINTGMAIVTMLQLWVIKLVQETKINTLPCACLGPW